MSDRHIQFGRIPYDVVASGALARMSGSEAKVYMAIAAHANRRWSARLSVATIGKESGLERRTVQRATRELQRKGLLGIQWGGGRGLANIYRLIRKGGPECAHSSAQRAHEEAPFQGEKGARAGAKGRTTKTEKAHREDRKSAPGAAPTEKNRPEQTSTEENAVGVCAPASTSDDRRIRGNGAILKRIGIRGDSTLTELARAPGLTPHAIVRLLAEAPKGVGNLPGWLRSRIEEGEIPSKPPTQEHLCKAVNRGFIKRVGSYTFEGSGMKAAWNRDAFCVRKYGQVIGRVPPSELATVELG